MSTFVIVPGIGAGAWQWSRVLSLLRARGHIAVAATLTGLGERSHLAVAPIGLDTHVRDVVNLIKWEELTDVILVGHSYGGVVIPGVADAVPDRLSTLVYLDSLVLRHGESQFDVRLPEDRERMRSDVVNGDGWRVPPGGVRPHLGLEKPEDVAFYEARRSPHPMQTLEDPVSFSNPTALALPRLMIQCVNPPRPDIGLSLDRVLGPDGPRAGWQYRSLPTGHLPNVTHPELLAATLDEVARAS